MFIQEMTTAQCFALLAHEHVARLGCSHAGKPYVVPIEYVLAGKRIYSFSLLGQKITWMRQNPEVCIQADNIENMQQWKSVLANGHYRELPDTKNLHEDHMRAWALLEKHANWWDPGGYKPRLPDAGSKPVFFFVEVDEVTGRIAIESSR
ncbi:pyridoxamine 5'-phosphate oxidase family protein [Rhizobium sp. ARZ01]|uniref:pyridoxamine 5'-phosphate oxidase family protein n=1 Tax=Rhizobium sp. ARZ01 TaxID=2769313 RepID=UPI00177AA105|nr:pyridoxamine 5'-phosphate oxidase family protein [Rhizobium sp. ARZ01]MBD9375688.1 pyridoxamine 5'-phosphate oxidase family protein [Rhizobium sp. ARZ01]